jgi:hypothetical protein
MKVHFVGLIDSEIKMHGEGHIKNKTRLHTLLYIYCVYILCMHKRKKFLSKDHKINTLNT